MKRVTAFVGSACKKHTHNTVRPFADHLPPRGDVEYEYAGSQKSLAMAGTRDLGESLMRARLVGRQLID